MMLHEFNSLSLTGHEFRSVPVSSQDTVSSGPAHPRLDPADSESTPTKTQHRKHQAVSDTGVGRYDSLQFESYVI